MSRQLVLAAGLGLSAGISQPDWRCQELCKHDEGIGGNMQQCLTECAIYVDLAPPHEKQSAAKKFVEDQSFNEKGGGDMKKAYSRLFGEKIKGCKTTVSLKSSPSFGDIDDNEDGQITGDEAVAYGNRMCVPDEMTSQIFTAADRNRDGFVTQEEFDTTGEDNIAEEAIDKSADPATEGDDEYAETSIPSFDQWDHDKDGYLQKGELFDAFMHEMKRRDVAEFGTVTAGTGKQSVQEETWHKIFDEMFPSIDMNGDGKVSRVEFNMDAVGSDFGGELHESAHADEDAEDPDDARRQIQATATQSEAPASMLRSGRASKVTMTAHFSVQKGLTDVTKVEEHRRRAASRFEAMMGRAADDAIRRRSAGHLRRH